MAASSRLWELLLPTTPKALIFHTFVAFLVVCVRFFFHFRSWGELPQELVDALIHPACAAPDVAVRLANCRLDHEQILALLTKGKVGGHSPAFHGLVRQYMRLPAAWLLVPDLLDPERPWTRRFCDTLDDDDMKVLASTLETFPFPSLYGLPPAAVVELVTSFVQGVGGAGRPEVAQMLGELKAASPDNFGDALAVVGRLFHHLHARPLQHLIDRGCGTSERLRRRVASKDVVGRTVLHLAAEQGDPFVCRALVEAHAAGEVRRAFVGIADAYGYVAEDDAAGGSFEEATEVLRSASGGATSSSIGRLETASVFPPPEQPAPAPEDYDSGGWNSSDVGAVPAAWLPDSENVEACSLDVIPEDHFDDWLFFRHYILHKRPLLIRNGARELAKNSSSWSRQGLVETAGERVVDTYRAPPPNVVRSEDAKGFAIAAYVDYLDKRRNADPSEKLQLASVPVPEGDSQLEWARFELPILEERLVGGLHEVRLYVGGVLMGSPPRHHLTHIFDSLVHGSKLWLLRPPAKPEFSPDTMHEYLSRGKGLGAMKCVQGPGDLLFVPSGWSHGSMCLGDCVGVAHDFEGFRVAHRDLMGKAKGRKT